MKKGKNGFKIDQMSAFLISGLIFMIVIASIKYAVMQPSSPMALIISFLFGGLVGHVAMSKKDSFLKNIVFIGAVTWIIWAILNPIDSVAGNLIIKQTEIMAIIAFVIILVEQEFVNSIRRMNSKPTKLRIGFLGLIALFILFNVSGLQKMVTTWLGQHWEIGVIVLLLWIIFLFIFLSTKGVKLGKKLFNKIGRILSGGKKK